MVLAIGLVVDDAIVVRREHPPPYRGRADTRRCGHRRHEGNLRPGGRDDDDARRRAMRRSASPAGLTGALFREFAFTLAGAVVISGIVAADHRADDGGAAPQASRRDGRFQRFVDRTFDAGRATGTSGGSPARSNYRAGDLRDRAALVWRRRPSCSCKTTTELAPEEDQGALSRHRQRPALRHASTTPSATPTQIHQRTKDIPEVDDTVL